ncbi:hypothetical protein Trydic_g5188, partial [Trypoxylus dichotomus]
NRDQPHLSMRILQLEIAVRGRAEKKHQGYMGKLKQMKEEMNRNQINIQEAQEIITRANRQMELQEMMRLKEEFNANAE